MSNQSEALRLADLLEQIDGQHWQVQDSAAAELRRLHLELERCKQVCAATSEGWRADAEEWKAQRDALLEALKSTGLFLHHCWCDVQMNDYSFEKLNQQMAVVDAAIAKAEGNT